MQITKEEICFYEVYKYFGVPQSSPLGPILLLNFFFKEAWKTNLPTDQVLNREQK